MRPLVERLRQVVERGDDIGSRNVAMMAEAADALESSVLKLEDERKEVTRLLALDQTRVDGTNTALVQLSRERDSALLRLDSIAKLMTEHHETKNTEDRIRLIIATLEKVAAIATAVERHSEKST